MQILFLCLGAGDEQTLDASISFTQKTQELKPSSFCFSVVSEAGIYFTAPVVYGGEDAVDKFLHLLQKEKHMKGFLPHVVLISINNTEASFQNCDPLSHLRAGTQLR